MGKCADIGALVVELPFSQCSLVGLVGNDHIKHIAADIAAGSCCMNEHPCRYAGSLGRLVDALAECKVEVTILRCELHSAIALSGCDQFDRRNRPGAELTGIHLKVSAFEIAMPLSPQLLHHTYIFGTVV